MSDEREALATTIKQARADWWGAVGGDPDEFLADRLWAAGWRRSPQPAWQPIDTAPKDGTKILVYRRMDPWDIYGVASWENCRGIDGWIARGIYDPPGELGLGAPTHWQPFRPPSEQPQPADPRDRGDPSAGRLHGSP